MYFYLSINFCCILFVISAPLNSVNVLNSDEVNSETMNIEQNVNTNQNTNNSNSVLIADAENSSNSNNTEIIAHVDVRISIYKSNNKIKTVISSPPVSRAKEKPRHINDCVTRNKLKRRVKIIKRLLNSTEAHNVSIFWLLGGENGSCQPTHSPEEELTDSKLNNNSEVSNDNLKPIHMNDIKIMSNDLKISHGEQEKTDIEDIPKSKIKYSSSYSSISLNAGNDGSQNNDKYVNLNTLETLNPKDKLLPTKKNELLQNVEINNNLDGDLHQTTSYSPTEADSQELFVSETTITQFDDLSTTESIIDKITTDSSSTENSISTTETNEDSTLENSSVSSDSTNTDIVTTTTYPETPKMYEETTDAFVTENYYNSVTSNVLNEEGTTTDSIDDESYSTTENINPTINENDTISQSLLETTTALTNENELFFEATQLATEYDTTTNHDMTDLPLTKDGVKMTTTKNKNESEAIEIKLLIKQPKYPYNEEYYIPVQIIYE